MKDNVATHDESKNTKKAGRPSKMRREVLEKLSVIVPERPTASLAELTE